VFLLIPGRHQLEVIDVHVGASEASGIFHRDILEGLVDPGVIIFQTAFNLPRLNQPLFLALGQDMAMQLLLVSCI
jgi:hypothetical protein